MVMLKTAKVTYSSDMLVFTQLNGTLLLALALSVGIGFKLCTVISSKHK